MNINSIYSLAIIFHKKASFSYENEENAIKEAGYFRGPWLDIKDCAINNKKYPESNRFLLMSLRDFLYSSIESLGNLFEYLEMSQSANEVKKISKKIKDINNESFLEKKIETISSIGEKIYRDLWNNNVKAAVKDIFDDEIFLMMKYF